MPHGQDAWVVLDRHRAGANAGAGLKHGGKLVELESFAALANPVLQKEDFTLTRQTQHHGNGQQQRRQHQQREARQDDVKKTLHDFNPFVLTQSNASGVKPSHPRTRFTMLVKKCNNQQPVRSRPIDERVGEFAK
jgi:hypothetical protein